MRLGRLLVRRCLRTGQVGPQSGHVFEACAFYRPFSETRLGQIVFLTLPLLCFNVCSVAVVPNCPLTF